MFTNRRHRPRECGPGAFGQAARTLACVLMLICSPALLASDVPYPDLPIVDDPESPKPYIMIEGDIMVPPDFFENMDTRAPWATNFWPGGIIPYEFNSNYTATMQDTMLAAMAEWERVADIDFIPRSGHDDYIHIRHDPTTNSSYVGLQGGRQDIRIASVNSRFVQCHELCHAMGFWHEQSRPNRDTYVQINFDNIQDGKEHNFNRHSDAGEWGPYDFESIMHYSQCAFSVCTSAVNPPYCICTSWVDPAQSPTIEVLPPNEAMQTQLGNRSHFSHYDTTIVSFIYAWDNWEFLSSEGDPGDQRGDFRHPYTNFSNAISSMGTSNVLWITEPGTYTASGVFTKPCRIRSALGTVTLSP